MRWEKLQMQSKAGQNMGPISGPGKRWGHTCNTIRGGKLLYVFGGYGRDNCQTNQVHVFDTATRTWSEPVMKGTPPPPRDSHSCTTVGDNLFVFGGTDGRNPLKDLHILDTSSHTWISPSVRGDRPDAREGHSAARIGKQLFIFGGCGKSSDTSDEEFYDDLYILNTGSLPAKRDSHTCSSWKNKIIVIGGEDSYDYYLSDVHILDADTSVWTKVMATGDGPSSRFSMAGDSLDPQKGGILVFLGGCSKNLEALDDMYYLHTGLTSENERDERRLEKLSLRKQLKLKCQEQNMISPPAYDKAVVRIETNADLYRPIPMPSIEPSKTNMYLREYHPFPGKKTFQAKVTKCFPVGYTIETVIDGKLLRGVLFSNKLSFNHTDNSSKRRKGAMEVYNVKLNDDQKSNSETARSNRQDKVDDNKADGVHEENMEAAAAASNMKSPVPSSDAQPHEVPGNLEVSVVADANVEEHETGIVPNASTEVDKGITSSAAADCVTISPDLEGKALAAEEHSSLINPAQSV
ncbi:galactose oxidase/kelch repeat superfamily protein [Actinidia rufa]|uniref:Galactose oxidase/kelch repeat superfamily protein n=1 Tax=Actinidia rufa TaxID=165716 RepID=A0A7J0DQK8_9ERIC|nr:galactose oxidase/kelch repeat superfamily protein [Actinidia rufa]